MALCVEAPRRPSSVARILGVSRSTATRQLRLLEQGGLVTRRPSDLDRRGVLYLVDRKRVAAIVAWLAGTQVAWDGSDGEPPVVCPGA